MLRGILLVLAQFFFDITLLGFEKRRVQGWPQKSSCLLRTRGIGSSKGTLSVN